MGALVAIGTILGLWLFSRTSSGGVAAGPEACVERGVPMTMADLVKRLRRLGYETGEGCDAAMREAVGRFQKDHGLAVKGVVDRSTEVYLRSLTPDLQPDLQAKTWEHEW